MIRKILPIRFDRRAVAAVEFAIIAPVMFGVFGGLGDFGLMMTAKSRLANAVSQGAQYALLTGPSVTLTNIESMITAAASADGLTQTVSYTNSKAPACFCVSGTTMTASTPALSAPNYTCTGTCTSGTANAYTTIWATFTYVPLTPFYSAIGSTKVNETVIVRLN